MMMKSLLLLFASYTFLNAQIAHAEEQNTAAINQHILKVATQYIHAVACETSAITAKNIIPLVPYTNEDDRWDAQYAVLWSGDVGCQGGSGTSTANLTTVKIGAGAFYYVDSTQSSPNIQYQSPSAWVTKVISYSKDRLVLEGKTYADDDPHCCPSLVTQFTLDKDNQGNWVKKEEQVITK